MRVILYSAIIGFLSLGPFRMAQHAIQENTYAKAGLICVSYRDNNPFTDTFFHPWIMEAHAPRFGDFRAHLGTYVWWCPNEDFPDQFTVHGQLANERYLKVPAMKEENK